MDQDLRDGDLSHTAEPLLAFTDKAVEMITQAMEREGVTDGGIRMTVAGGGCEGFQYSLHLDEAARTDDEVVVQDGIRAFLDPVSAQHLHGTLLDFISNRQGTGFHFFRLEAARTIGCGSSMLLRRCIAGNIRTTGCIKSAKRPLMELGQAVATVGLGGTASIAHPGLRPLSLCNKCHYVICRCQETA
jgi:iron-sulfur cluster assembly accessory protein